MCLLIYIHVRKDIGSIIITVNVFRWCKELRQCWQRQWVKDMIKEFNKLKSVPVSLMVSNAVERIAVTIVTTLVRQCLTASLNMNMMSLECPATPSRIMSINIVRVIVTSLKNNCLGILQFSILVKCPSYLHRCFLMIPAIHLLVPNQPANFPLFPLRKSQYTQIQ